MDLTQQCVQFCSGLYMQRYVALCVFIVIGNLLAAPVADGSDIENNLNIKIGNHGFELTQANNLQRQELVQSVCDNHFTSSGDGYVEGSPTKGSLLSTTTSTTAQISDSQPFADIPDDQLDHLLIDEKHKFLYCYVPKVSHIISERIYQPPRQFFRRNNYSFLCLLKDFYFNFECLEQKTTSM